MTFWPLWWRVEFRRLVRQFRRIIRQFFNLFNAGIRWNLLKLKTKFKGAA